VSSGSYFSNENVNWMTLHPVYILKEIVNRMEDIRFSNFFCKKTEGNFGYFNRTILIFSKFIEVQKESIEVQKESVHMFLNSA